MFFLFSVGAVEAAGITGGDRTLGYSLVLFLHQVLFVFWLGPDIGVYMWSTKVTNSELSPAQRVSAGRIMSAIEIIPRVCMSLMLTAGGVLTELKGIEHPWWQMVAIWGLGPVWLGLTLFVYSSGGLERYQRLDTWFRWAVIASVIVSVGYSLATERLVGYPWVTAKLLLFAAVVFFGLLMQQRLRPFKSALGKLEADGPDEQVDETLRGCVARARVFMFASWIALALAAGLGTFQPGSPASPAEQVLDLQ